MSCHSGIEFYIYFKKQTRTATITSSFSIDNNVLKKQYVRSLGLHSLEKADPETLRSSFSPRDPSPLQHRPWSGHCCGPAAAGKAL